ncbi:MAG: hypothetical protein H6836_06460 [Planctomycetes bacterium]|nr:hypothetical protein [Planctomycetota bacterium]
MPESPTPSKPDDPGLTQPPRWLAAVLLPAVGAALLWWNLDGWMHPIIDYGRELYVPWRITEGEAPYRDIAYFNGPLSPYVNATWFSLLGVSLRTLTLANYAVIAGVTALLYRLLADLADRMTALCGGIAFLSLFAFQMVEPMANFNWVSPYSHEATHGVALGLSAIACVTRFARVGALRWLTAAGLLAGGSFLTKPEVCLATLLAVAAGVATGARRAGAPALGRQLAVLGIGLLVPVAAAWALLATAMPAGMAWRGTLGGWVHLFDGRLAQLRYYAECMGVDDLGKSLAATAFWAAHLVGALLLITGLAFAFRRGRATAPVLVALAVAPAALLLFIEVPWAHPFRPLGLVTAGILGALVRARIRGGATPRNVLRVAFATFATALLLKIALNVRFHHYGFALAMPAAMLGLAALLSWLPRAVARRGASAAVFRAGSLGLLCLTVCGFLATEADRFGKASRVLGPGPDSFRTNPKSAMARHLTQSVAWLRAHTPPDATVLVLPEGITVNYFARRRNPTGHINFMPPEVIMFGEQAILAALQAHPPDYVVVLHRPTREYGLPLFGTDYGRSILHWVGRTYREVHAIGAEPLHANRLKDKMSGMVILRRPG